MNRFTLALVVSLLTGGLAFDASAQTPETPPDTVGGAPENPKPEEAAPVAETPPVTETTPAEAPKEAVAEEPATADEFSADDGDWDETPAETGKGGDFGVQTSDDFEEVAMSDLISSGDRLRFFMNFYGDAGGMVSFGGVGDYNEQHTFNIGSLGLLMTGEIDENLRSVGELSFKFDRANRRVAEVERLTLRWANERFWVSVGRDHTNFGYWNTSFHHGMWLQPKIARPRVVAFEDQGGLLPVHTTGVSAGMKARLGDMTVLNLNVGVGNGRGSTSSNVLSVVDNNDAKSVVVGFNLTDLFTPGFRFGGSFLLDTIKPENEAIRPVLPDEELTELMGNAHLVYSGSKLSVIFEAYLLNHIREGEAPKDLPEDSLLNSEDWWLAFTWYIYAGYRFGNFVPYASLEFNKFSDELNPYLFPTGEVTGNVTGTHDHTWILGLRYDTSAASSLRVEAQRYEEVTDDPNAAPLNRVMVNWAFGI